MDIRNYPTWFFFMLWNWLISHSNMVITIAPSTVQSTHVEDIENKDVVTSTSCLATLTPPMSSPLKRSLLKDAPVIGLDSTRKFNLEQDVMKGMKSSVRGNSSFADEDDRSLQCLLLSIIFEELNKCDLMFIVNGHFKESTLLGALLRSNNLRQVIVLTEAALEIAERMLWISPRCQGILVLISDPNPLLELGDQWANAWDYKARVIVAGVSKESLEGFLRTKKIKKTQHVVGIVKAERVGIFKIFMNELFGEERGIRQLTTWRRNSFTKKTNLFPDKISNLHKNELNVALFEYPPAIIYQRGVNNTITERYGRDVAVVKALSKAFNFTIFYRALPPGQLWGVKLPNGSYNGIVGLLGSSQADMGIANNYLTSLGDRSPFQEYSTPFSNDLSCFLARVEPPLPPWQSPAFPYQFSAWTGVFVGFLLAGPVLYLIVYFNYKTHPDEDRHQSMIESCLYNFGVHFSQSVPTLPSRSSIQIFIAFLWIYSIILTTGYKSNLTAFLTITRQPQSIETFKELYASGLTVLGSPFFKLSLKRAGNRYLKALTERYDIRYNLNEARGEILDGKAVAIYSRMYLEMFAGLTSASRVKTSLRIMKECFGQFAVVILYQKYSPLRPKFDRAVTRMFESGLPRKWFLMSVEKYEKEKDTNKDASRVDNYGHGNGVLPLGLDHLQGVFILLIIGFILSLTVIVFELLSRCIKSA